MFKRLLRLKGKSNLLQRNCRSLSEKVNSVSSVESDKLFSEVAERYNTMFNVASFGYHGKWKDSLVDQIGMKPFQKVLDVGCGTGDIVLKYLSRLKKQRSDNLPVVDAFDINQPMLDFAQTRAKKLGFENTIIWQLGDAQDLPYKSNQFDVYVLAFGIRYAEDKSKVFSEAYRVLKPNGKFLCLDLGVISDNKFAEKLFKWHLMYSAAYTINALGLKEHYANGSQTLFEFPHPKVFTQYIRDNSEFSNLNYTPLKPFGFANIFSGYKK